MVATTHTFRARTEDATARIAEAIASVADVGDLITLSGELGAGKTSFVRSAIRWLAGDPERSIASPTFALAQVHDDLVISVTHADFYRLETPEDARELALEEALETGVVFVEWPDKGDLPTLATFSIAIQPGEDETDRRIVVTADETAASRLERLTAVRDFLASAGWGEARRCRLQGDASTRRYEKLSGAEQAILMDSPRQPDGQPIRDGLPYSRLAHLAESITPFIAVANWLAERGLSVPAVGAYDLDQGLAVLSDLGAVGLVDDAGTPIAPRYEAAVGVLTELHRCAAPKTVTIADQAHAISAYDRDVMMVEVELFADWFAPAAIPQFDTSMRDDLLDAWRSALTALPDTPPVLVLRDYHSANLMWRDGSSDIERIAVIDFQDALAGHPAYDVVSLCQDARTTVPPALEAALLDRYRHLAEPPDWTAFETAYALLGAQRATKILGIFVRLHRRDRKPDYLRHLTRVGIYLGRDLAHPALAPVASWLSDALNCEDIDRALLAACERIETDAI